MMIPRKAVPPTATVSPRDGPDEETDVGPPSTSELLKNSEWGEKDSGPKGRAFKNQKRTWKDCWRTSTIMTAALLTGILFALGHHLFYARYDGAIVQGSMGQKWINRIGTAFAFLVKTFLGIAAGSAYVQRQWLYLGSRSHRIGNVDAMFGILGDATLFMDRVWLGNILLATLAAVTWILPFAAVVTPGSLVVEPMLSFQDTMLKPPQLLYSILTFVDQLGDSESYDGPNNIVSRIAIATATSGQILQIQSSHPNQSYSLEFYGPAIRCTENAEVLKAIIKNHAKVEDELYLTFAAWVPSDSVHGAPSYNFTSASTQAYETIEVPNNGYSSRMSLMVASTNQDFSLGDTYHGDQLSSLAVHECTLHNASYVVDFAFRYPSQNVTLRSLQVNEVLRSNDYEDFYMHNGDYDFHNRRLSYKAVMDAFGAIIVGGSYYSEYGKATIFGGSRYTQTSLHWGAAKEAGPSLEKLFQNITLSLLSAPELIANSTMARAVNATITTSPNTYVYSPFDLWLPYGLAIGATLLCVGAGFEAMLRNRATYSNRFSTIIRTTRDARFDNLIDADDDGSDPLPKRIAQAELSHEGHRKSARGRHRKRKEESEQ